MRGSQVLIISGLLSAFILAGCVDDAEPPEVVDDPEPTGPRSLAELTCEFTYPDNETPIPCENQFPESSLHDSDRPGTATAMAESQEPWVCVDQLTEPAWGYSIHWDPDTDRFGMYYHFNEVDRPLDAVFYAGDGSVGTVLYGIDPTGFIVLPDVSDSGPPENVRVVNFNFYIHDYVTDTPELEGGEIQAHWSFWDGTPYPIHEITTDEGSYFFHNVTEKKGEGGRPLYEMQAFQMEGEDYNVTVQYSEQKALQISWNPRPFFCTLV